MVCYHPQKMWPPSGGGGRWVHSPAKSYAGSVPSLFACNGCQGCRARVTAEWTARMAMESRYHDDAWFITWTYANEHLPPDYSVSKPEVQLLLKRVRREFNCGDGSDGRPHLRSFTVAEYGDSEEGTKRPHYHSILWGLPLADLTDERRSQSGFPIWKSPRLESCWGKGFVDVARADRASMSYCAGYVHKKRGGKLAEEAYRRVHPVTGEVLQVAPEFALMSRRPGIGFRWAEEFKDSDLKHDDVRVEGRRMAMPGYLRRKEFEWLPQDGALSEAFMAKLLRSADAKAQARKRAHEMTPERLAVREESHYLRTKHLARGGDV